MTITMPLKPACKRGDLVHVLFPNSYLLTAKSRPTLIVQADVLATDLQQTIVAMISSRMFRTNHSSRIAILRIPPKAFN